MRKVFASSLAKAASMSAPKGAATGAGAPRYGLDMDALIRISAGAPASALLLGAMLAFSMVGLYASPALIARHVLRPYGLVDRGDYQTLVTSGFVHADLAHLLLNAF